MERRASWEANSSPATPEIPSIVSRKCITTLARYRHCRCSESDQSVASPNPILWISILILPFHLHLDVPNLLSPSCLPSKTLYTRVLSLIHAAFSIVLAFLHLIARDIAGEDYRSWSFLFCSLIHSSVTSSSLGPSLSLSTLFSDILSAYSFLSVRDQFLCPYTTPNKILVLCILIL